MHLAQGGIPLDIVRGEGSRVFDAKGRAYVDFTAGAGVGAVGWGRAEVAEAMIAQASEGIYVPPFLQWPRWEELAERVAKLAPGGLERVYRATGGSEAVEIGLKAMRASRGGKPIACVSGLYHGHTLGAASAGDMAWPPVLGEPLPGFLKIPYPGRGAWDEGVAALERIAETTPDLAGFFTEPVFSNPGIHVPPRSFWDGVKSIVRRHGLLLGVDEVVTGFGRCGATFASDLYGLEPDVMCLGKGMSGGYGGIGATVVTEEVYAKCNAFTAYSTYGWHPVSTVASLATLDILDRERLAENARRVGGHLLSRLREMEGDRLRDARGAGLLLAFDVTKEDGAPDALGARRLMQACLDRGLLLVVLGQSTVALTPALSIDRATIDEGADLLMEAWREGPRRA